VAVEEAEDGTVEPGSGHSDVRAGESAGFEETPDGNAELGRRSGDLVWGVEVMHRGGGHGRRPLWMSKSVEVKKGAL
jgi:hypothetical protein